MVEYIVDKATALHAKEGQYSGSGGVSLSRSNSNISMSGSSGGFGSLLHLSQVILNQRDRWGKTPLQEAKLLQLDDLVEVLEKGMAVLGITN